jgi:hypothetical protein
MEGDFLFVASPSEVFAEELTHPRLRSIDVWSFEAWQSVRADALTRLRRLCFPRLLRLTIDGQSLDVYQEG